VIMKKTILAILLVMCIFTHLYGQSSSPIDLILVLDTSSAMSSSYANVTNYLSGPFLTEFLRTGDTFHLIPFSGTPRLDAARRISGVGDVETIIGRMLLQYPVENASNPAAALSYAEQYASTLPDRRKKIVLISTGSPDIANLLNTSRQRIGSNNTLDFILVTPGQPLTDLPSSGRPPAARISDSGQAAISSASAPQATASQTQRPQTSATPAQSTAPSSASPAQSTTQSSTSSAQSTTPSSASPAQSTTQSSTSPAQSTTPSSTSPAQSTAQTTPAQSATQTTPSQNTTPSSASPAQSTVPSSTTPAQSTTQSSTTPAQSTTPSSASPAQNTAQSSASPAQSTTQSSTSPAQSTASQSSSQAPSAGSSAAKTGDSGSGFSDSMPLIIALIVLAILILGLIIFFATRKLGSSPNRVMSEAASKTDTSNVKDAQKEKFSDHSSDLAAYAAGQAKRSTPYANRAAKTDNTKSVVINPSGPLLLNLHVEDQNTAIGKRNIHSLKSGYSLTVGGGKSDDYLIFLVPMPAHIGDIRRNGSQLIFTPRKPKYFPDIGSSEVRDCINKTIRVISDKNYEMSFRFEMYEDPLVALNRMLMSVRVPG